MQREGSGLPVSKKIRKAKTHRLSKDQQKLLWNIMKASNFRSIKEMKQKLGSLNEICVITGFELLFTDGEK